MNLQNIITSSMDVSKAIKLCEKNRPLNTFNSVYIHSLPSDFEECVSQYNIPLDSFLTNVFAPDINFTFDNKQDAQRSMLCMFDRSVINTVTIKHFGNVENARFLFRNCNIGSIAIDISTMDKVKHVNSMFDGAELTSLIVRNKDKSKFSPISMQNMFECTYELRTYKDIIENILPNEKTVNCTAMFAESCINTSLTLKIERANNIRSMFRNCGHEYANDTLIDMRSLYIENVTPSSCKNALAIAPIENSRTRIRFKLNTCFNHPRIIGELLGKSCLYNTIQIVSKPEDDYFTIIQTERAIF